MSRTPWGNLDNVPTSFPPAAHSHASWNDIVIADGISGPIIGPWQLVAGASVSGYNGGYNVASGGGATRVSNAIIGPGMAGKFLAIAVDRQGGASPVNVFRDEGDFIADATTPTINFTQNTMKGAPAARTWTMDTGGTIYCAVASTAPNPPQIFKVKLLLFLVAAGW